jgi:hypothetical protein
MRPKGALLLVNIYQLFDSLAIEVMWPAGGHGIDVDQGETHFFTALNDTCNHAPTCCIHGHLECVLGYEQLRLGYFSCAHMLREPKRAQFVWLSRAPGSINIARGHAFLLHLV